jgi:lambda repressor-like predicted transcriptional regulator
MPRGRGKESPTEAKRESVLRILGALDARREGLSFTALREETKLHQDTLSVRLKDLIASDHVKYDRLKRLYLISAKGEQDRYRRTLLELIESDQSYAVVGGPGGRSVLNPGEDLILKSTIGYAFPGINVGVLADIKNLVHKRYVLDTLHSLANDLRSDDRRIGQKSLNKLGSELRRAFKSKQQVIAILIDHQEIAENLSKDYLNEILQSKPSA